VRRRKFNLRRRPKIAEMRTAWPLSVLATLYSHIGPSQLTHFHSSRSPTLLSLPSTALVYETGSAITSSGALSTYLAQAPVDGNESAMHVYVVTTLSYSNTPPPLVCYTNDSSLQCYSPALSFPLPLIAFRSRLAAGLSAFLIFCPPCNHNQLQKKTTAKLKAQKAQKMP